MLADIGFVSNVDVLVCIHGAACGNSFFGRNGSSLVRVVLGGSGIAPPPPPLVNTICHPLFPGQIEIRPHGMSKGWANGYFFKQLHFSEGHVHWYGIDILDPKNSKPSELEEQDSAALNPQVRGWFFHLRPRCHAYIRASLFCI